MRKQTDIKAKNDVLKSSNRCNQNYIYKTEKWGTCSKIDENISDMILHIDESYDEKRMLLCLYHIPFCGDFYCSCPARMYIYKRYKV